MFIKRVILEDLKGIRALDFDFARPPPEPFAGWSVITGDNGSGKTILLKAIAMAIVGPTHIRSLQPTLKGWVRAGCKSAYIGLEIAPNNEIDGVTTGRKYAKSFWSELQLSIGRDDNVTLSPGTRRNKGKQRGPLNGPWADSTSGWFAVGYGPFRRLRGTSPDAQRLMSGVPRIARFATLFKEDATLQECEQWLKSLSHKKLEGHTHETRLLEAVKQLLDDEFLRKRAKINRIDSDGVWLQEPRGNIINLSDMSEGYRAALAMMIDILQHLVSEYRTLILNRGPDGSLSVGHHGVVMIDEVDAHLHPAWQQEIGLWMKQRFPNVQFIVTTHSPHICQAADQGGLFHLPSVESKIAPRQLTEEEYRDVVRGRANDVLLSPAFGLTSTRSPRAEAALARYSQLHAKRRSVKLSQTEQGEMEQLALFLPDENA